MAILQEIQLNVQSRAESGLTHTQFEFAKGRIMEELWAFLIAHEDEEVFTLNLIFWSKRIKWKHIFPALERLLGPRPA